MAGIVYLLHFEKRYEPYEGAPLGSTAQHYTGYVSGGPNALKRRLRKHGTVNGAKLMIAVRKAGISWVLARTWRGGQDRERQLKKQGSARRYCPQCGVEPRFRLCDLPVTRVGAMANSLISDRDRHRAGLMTRADREAHTMLRSGLVTGRCELNRLPKIPIDDQWYVVPPAVGKPQCASACAARSASAPRACGGQRRGR